MLAKQGLVNVGVIAVDGTKLPGNASRNATVDYEQLAREIAAYCLNPDHEIGGPKAQGFRRILGIELADLEYLAEALGAGILTVPITRRAR